MTPDPAWLQRLVARLDEAPSPPRLPLELGIDGGSTATIGSIDATLALDLAGAGFALRDTGPSWRLQLTATHAIDPTLAEMARWLRAEGRASAWREELLDVADPAGQVVGRIERAAVRPLGIATRAVHLVVGEGRGAAWVQQRAFDKAVDPGLWDTTMGGIVSAGETTRETLARETWEEAGLRLEQLADIETMGRFTVRRPLPEGYMVEHIDMFRAVARAGALPANQDGEVAGFEALAPALLLERLHADAFTLEAAMILVHWLRV